MIDQEFSVDSPSAKVQLRSGSLEIRPGDPGVIRVLVDTKDDAFVIDRRADTIVIGGNGGGRRLSWAAVTLQVPQGCDVTFTASGAGVTSTQSLGRFEVATSSGDIRFGTVRRLQAKSASGNIRGDAVTGEARVVTASGDIKIGSVGERGSFSTASGDIRIDSSEATLSAATVSGDVRVERMAGPELQAKSMSGRVRLGIPSGTRLDLDANTFSGRVRLPDPDPNPAPPEREMSVKVRLVSGDLKITRV